MLCLSHFSFLIFQQTLHFSPSALNVDFYSKINTLAPFGSGNPEPKFAIENLKIINSKIVGEKHIKSILLGADGSRYKIDNIDIPVINRSLNVLKGGNSDMVESAEVQAAAENLTKLLREEAKII